MLLPGIRERIVHELFIAYSVSAKPRIAVPESIAPKWHVCELIRHGEAPPLRLPNSVTMMMGTPLNWRSVSRVRIAGDDCMRTGLRARNRPWKETRDSGERSM